MGPWNGQPLPGVLETSADRQSCPLGGPLPFGARPVRSGGGDEVGEVSFQGCQWFDVRDYAMVAVWPVASVDRAVSSGGGCVPRRWLPVWSTRTQ
jgi:hypothetical protein